jgi:hypothetical protein
MIESGKYVANVHQNYQLPIKFYFCVFFISIKNKFNLRPRSKFSDNLEHSNNALHLINNLMYKIE